MNKKQIIAFIFVIFTVFVWPTRYKYLPSEKNFLALRINRLTGKAEYLHSDGWVKLYKEKVKETRELLSLLPYKEYKNISGVARIRGRRLSSSSVSDVFIVEVYNGSSYNLKEITITITVKEENGDIRWFRQFQEKAAFDDKINPQTSGKFIFEVPRIGEAEWSWAIAEYRGTIEKRKPLRLSDRDKPESVGKETFDPDAYLAGKASKQEEPKEPMDFSDVPFVEKRKPQVKGHLDFSSLPEAE